MEPGDCHYMPEGCHHELMACSDDLEMIEMYSPGEIGEVEISEWRK
jgi:mannose-6-phosphate isomerase-like protein (cupin superfamily)